ncbi:MAG: hypothetical protein WB697_01930 [Stellaceae bacterium]
MFEYYAATSPATSVPGHHKIIEMSNHGNIFYIDENQSQILWHFTLATFVFLPIGGIFLKK